MSVSHYQYSRPDPFQQAINIRTPSGTITEAEVDNFKEKVTVQDEENKDEKYLVASKNSSFVKKPMTNNRRGNDSSEERQYRSVCLKCILQ